MSISIIFRDVTNGIRKWRTYIIMYDAFWTATSDADMNLSPYWIVNLIENCSKLLRRSDSSLVSFRLADYAFCHNFPCAWLVLVHRFYLKQQKKCCRRHWYIRTAECLTSYCTLSTKSVAFLNVFFLIY